MDKVRSYLDAYLRSFRGNHEKWNYEDGCVLLGAQRLYEVTGEEAYADLIVSYLDSYVAEDGTIAHYEKEKYNIDNINTGKSLFFAYDRTGNEKYRKAIELLMDQLRNHPRCESGNFFHKKIYPDQIWLDGLFMAQPFYMAYTTRYEKKEHYADIVSQFVTTDRYLYNPEKGLSYHACDTTKRIFWADPETGCSKNFWLRSIGWYLMALVDTMDLMSEEIYEQYRTLVDLYRKSIKGILQYQDPETGLFYQVVDHPEAEGNYPEASGSAMVACTIFRACKAGILLPEKYLPAAEKIMAGLRDILLKEVDGKTVLTNCCSVAGLGPADNPRRDGTVAYYLSEPVVCDDEKAVGAYMMAVAAQMAFDKEKTWN
ncbi:MAG: glycoside hydrolase family 88 protein [Lachnospiraceae bacterium]|nr:glycoside hydrolase family 88 protein [Lachnospiraceae bacterium]